jgi:zinc transport system substrate-binding protein
MQIVAGSMVFATMLSGCGSTSSDPSAGSPAAKRSRPTVYVSFYPIEEATRAIAGDTFDVVSLTPTGVSPHELDIPSDVLAGMEDAVAVLYLGRGFQPSVEKAVASLPSSVRTVDLLDSSELLPVDPAVPGVSGEVDGEVLEGNVDPHVWVDPARFEAITQSIETVLTDLAPSDGAGIAARAKTYQADLQTLDAEFKTRLTTCESTAIVTSHRAFGYLANRYGLEQLPIAGISPDEEPDPKSLIAVANAAKAKGVTVVFFESLVPKKLSETVAAEIGASTDALDPIEGLTQEAIDSGENYVTVQRRNLEALRRGLRCA